MAGPINSFGRWLAKKMPKRLYARSLIIIIAPMVLLQSVIAYVFMERHWQMVTERLSTAVVRDISAIIDIIETYPQDDNYNNITRIAQQRMGLNISILPPDPLPPPGPKPFFAILDYFLSEEITRQINRPFWIDTVGDSDLVEIRIRLDNHVLRVFAMRSQAYASNTGIFLSWMIGTALVLLIIAIFFLRNQIKPIQQLAAAADSFGRGLPLPEGFEPRGAEEVRRAGTAFLRMRKRIERQIEQRTMMLSGVSHDLRTILTRFKLQLALAKGSFDTAPLEQDIADMQNMLEGYLAFARGEGTENVGELDLSELMKTLQKDAALRERGFVYHIEGSPLVQLKPKAFSRLVSNLVSNSFRYAKNVNVAIVHDDNDLVIIIDDDGPGIPANMREEVFKPFFRLDEARNQDASGTGLGLSIAQDIARSHGGNIVLDDSPTGGLRVIVEIPL
ncbi:two-component system, OmpR family, osmolarity sensor histidine kinase EnvZ [Bartonella apihabitans]|uniref:ATP-binding protein n=1 Tax=Bartonella apihabitans TaxID=2750929 RepID=UPI00098FB41F|nr:ATP-binding protein [Bartonella apihabitans]AQT45315.1 two-component system, OmpR family, osmolarity sensor histidine kinase EnvZ [Bartonella apihabitans]